MLPDFWRRSNKTDFTSFYGPPFTNNRMWRKCLAREFLPAEHPERSQRYNSTQAVILLDARERDEYDSDHIPGVVLSPVGTIDKDTAAEVLSEKGPTVLVYCRGGNRSKTISSTLAKLRYTNIYAFDGINSLIL